eukprot:183277-Prorocentrum_lima.AAC.1
MDCAEARNTIDPGMQRSTDHTTAILATCQSEHAELCEKAQSTCATFPDQPGKEACLVDICFHVQRSTSAEVCGANGRHATDEPSEPALDAASFEVTSQSSDSERQLTGPEILQ